MIERTDPIVPRDRPPGDAAGRPGRLVAADLRVAFRAPSRGAAPTVALDGLTLDVAAARSSR